jgi:hypothetical protein
MEITKNGEEKKRVFLTVKALDALMTPGNMVHTFASPTSNLLFGADWPRALLLAAAEKYGAELAGADATAMHHGAVVWIILDEKRIPLFVSTTTE